MNPFDDESAQFHVLVNDEEQHSLWPVFAPVPAGWTPRLGPVTREEALAYVEQEWPDIRPKSLREASSTHH
jgi:MbtH protein